MGKVIFTRTAEIDLVGIEDYIREILYNPNAAIRIVDGIVDTAEKLSLFPKKHQFVRDQFLAEIGFRMVIFDNYNIFYFYDESADAVHIVRVLYNRVDWENILRQ